MEENIRNLISGREIPAFAGMTAITYPLNRLIIQSMNKTIQNNIIVLSGLFLLIQNTMVPAAFAATTTAYSGNIYNQAATSSEPIMFDSHINSSVAAAETTEKNVAATTKEEIRAYVLNEAKKLGLSTVEVDIIVNCESKWNDKAFNDKNSNGSTDSGLWQINSIHKSISDADKMDYKAATKWALEKRLRDGSWSAWSCSRKLASK